MMQACMKTVRTASIFRPATRRTLPSLARAFSATTRRRDVHAQADTTTFAKVLETSKSNGKVVLVDFYADWCQPCRMLSPILTKLASAEANEKTGSGAGLDLITVNTDEQGDLAMQYEVSALPTVIAFKDGIPTQKFVGALPETRVRAFLSGL